MVKNLLLKTSGLHHIGDSVHITHVYIKVEGAEPFVRQYLELYAAFDAVDDDNDNRITFEEFETSTAMLASWGVEVDDPAAAFAGKLDIEIQILRNGFVAH